MADSNFLELLFVRRYLVKYLRANLDAERGTHLPNAEDIRHDLGELLPRPEVIALEGQGKRSGSLRIALREPDYRNLPKVHHDKILKMLEECFREEMFFFVKQQHSYMGATLEESMLCFMGQYGINEDDLSLDDMKRNWRRMAVQRGKPRERPGRPLKPLAALRWPRNRDRIKRMMQPWPAARTTQQTRTIRTGKPKLPKDTRTQLSFFPPAR